MERTEVGGNEYSWECGTKDLAGADPGLHDGGGSENGKDAKRLRRENEHD